MPSLETSLALLGALVTCCISAPQGIKVFRQPDQIEGVSILTLVFVMINSCIWFAWGVVSGNIIAGCLPSAVNGPIAAATAAVVIRSRRTAAPT
jgi:uncharacterized protein with PQ loop repeat